MDQAGQIVHVLPDDALAPQHDHHQECPQVHERVDQHVNRDSLEAGGVAGDQAEQHVSGVGDGAIGQQALDVGLGDGGEVPDRHGGEGDHDEQRLPSGPEGGHRAEEDSQQECERRGLRGDGKVRGNRSRRALISVRRPHVEGNGGNLEQQPDRGGGHHEEHHRIPGLARGDGDSDDGQLGGARNSVHQRKAIGQEAAGKGAEDQILHGRLVRSPLPAQEPDHDVETQRHQLQSDEQRDQIRAGRQEKHAALRKQNQPVVLAMMLPFDVQVLVRHDRNDERREQEDPIEEQREAVHDERALETGHIDGAAGSEEHLLPPQREARQEFAGDHEDQQQILALLRIGNDPGVEQQNGASEERQHDGGD